MNIVGIDCEHPTDEVMAKDALRALVDHYPGHDWNILVRGGVWHVKALNIHPNWGMCQHYASIKGDAKDRVRVLVRAAGEFLERANLRRGARTQADPRAVEGIPDKEMRKARL